MWEPLSWKTWLARFKRAGGQDKDHYSVGLRDRVSGLLLVRWHLGWNHFLLFSCQPPKWSAVALFFLSKKIMSFLETRNMHSPTSLSVANLTIVTGCHCVMLRSSPWLVRQDKDIVLFSLTCGSRLDLVDLLGGDPVDLLELSWSCWLVRQGSCLVLVDLLGGDLIRNDRTLASHHLGRARVVRERDKSVQVGHLPARLNLGCDNWTSWIKQEPVCNLPAPGRAKDVLEGAPSGPSRRSQSCNSANWSSPFPSPSEHKTGG